MLKPHRYAFLLDWHSEVNPGGTSQSAPTHLKRFLSPLGLLLCLCGFAPFNTKSVRYAQHPAIVGSDMGLRLKTVVTNMPGCPRTRMPLSAVDTPTCHTNILTDVGLKPQSWLYPLPKAPGVSPSHTVSIKNRQQPKLFRSASLLPFHLSLELG